MTRECAFTLPSGRKCRAAATRNLALCRHHTPKPAVSGPPPPLRRDVFSRHIRWTQLGRLIPWLEPDEIPREVHSILRGLLEDGPLGISDREAGRLLRSLLRRVGEVPFPLPGATGPGEASDPNLDPDDSDDDAGDDSAAAASFAALLESLNRKLPKLPSTERGGLQTQPGLPQFQPNPRHIQPNLTHMQPSSK